VAVNVGLARGYSAAGDLKKALEHAKTALGQAPDEGNKKALEKAIELLSRAALELRKSGTGTGLREAIPSGSVPAPPASAKFSGRACDHRRGSSGNAAGSSCGGVLLGRVERRRGWISVTMRPSSRFEASSAAFDAAAARRCPSS
jgi:hypothetical protein